MTDFVFVAADDLVLRFQHARVIGHAGLPDDACRRERQRQQCEEGGVEIAVLLSDQSKRADAGEIERQEHVGEFAPSAPRLADVLDQELIDFERNAVGHVDPPHWRCFYRRTGSLVSAPALEKPGILPS